jgi:hypothetical protein
VNRSIATSISRALVSVVSTAAVTMADSSRMPGVDLYDRKVLD